MERVANSVERSTDVVKQKPCIGRYVGRGRSIPGAHGGEDTDSDPGAAQEPIEPVRQHTVRF